MNETRRQSKHKLTLTRSVTPRNYFLRHPSPHTNRPSSHQRQPPQIGQTSTPVVASFARLRSIIAALSPTSQLDSGDLFCKLKLSFVSFGDGNNGFDRFFKLHDLPLMQMILQTSSRDLHRRLLYSCPSERHARSGATLGRQHGFPAGARTDRHRCR
jgi:hypothetical protein